MAVLVDKTTLIISGCAVTSQPDIMPRHYRIILLQAFSLSADKCVRAHVSHTDA